MVTGLLPLMTFHFLLKVSLSSLLAKIELCVPFIVHVKWGEQGWAHHTIGPVGLVIKSPFRAKQY